MSRSHRHHAEFKQRDILLPALAICGLAVAVLLSMLWTDQVWRGPVAVIALGICLGMMLLIGHRMGKPR